MLALLSALTLLAALVVIVIVVAVRGALAFLHEVEHEALLKGAGSYGLRGALHHEKLHRRLFAGSVQRLFHHITQGFRHAVSNVGILLCDGIPSSLIAFAML